MDYKTIDFEKVDDQRDLSDWLCCSEDFIDRLIDEKECLVSELKIPKKLGERIVYDVEEEGYRQILKILCESLAEVSKSNISDAAHGFIKGRSIVTNAKCHLSKKQILNLDIKNFFDSIDIQLVNKIFRDIGCNDSIAEILSKICTINAHLAQGFNTSPIISNIVFFDIDQVLLKKSRKKNIIYTRYVDDLTFSSDGELFGVKEVESILGKYGFELNKLKTRLQRKGGHQYVTGLTVVDEKYPRIPRRVKRNMRLEIYNLKKMANFCDSQSDLENIRAQIKDKLGTICYLYSVEPQVAERFRNQIDEIKSILEKKF